MVEFKSNSRRALKKGIDADKGRRRRDETRIQIRKTKKEEGLQKRRAMVSKETVPAVQESNMLSNSSLSNPQLSGGVADIPVHMSILQKPESSNEEKLLAIQGFRKMLSLQEKPPVQQVLEAGALPLFVQLLNHEATKIQFEAAWALTNVASTDHTRSVVEQGAVPRLIQLLLSGDANVREQSAWCLGNIAGDATDLRDILLQEGALDPLLKNISCPGSNSLLSNCVWALSNFCRGKPQPNLEYVAPAIPVLANLLTMNNKEALMDACWALSYLSDGDDSRINAVMSVEGMTRNIVSLLGHECNSVVTPAVRVLGNFVSGNDVQTQAVIDAGVLKYVDTLLNCSKKTIRKEMCWLLSNIAAGSQLQISQLMRSAKDMLLIVDTVREAPWDIRKEATWVICNIATGGTDDHVHNLVNLGAIDALCSVLDHADAKITMVVLDGIANILKVGKRAGRDYVGFVDECDGLDKIEALQEHQDNAIYQKVVEIIETYFGVEEVDDENILPAMDGNSFAFGTVTKAGEYNQADGAFQQPLQPFNFAS